uniref:WAP domain-containing protein n=1 Tax=Graphocephala atropunctata TaxID=36148 RepID=A0A1B6KC21_9HEMI
MLMWLLLTLLLLSVQGHGKVVSRTNCTATTKSNTEPPEHTEKPHHRTPLLYECMEDWPITCTEDSQCCSKECLKPFCKILGIEKPEKPMKGKGRKILSQKINHC